MKVRQHFVPQFYLRKFARHTKPDKYIIHCFDKASGKNFTRNVKDIGMEKFFYDNKDPPIIENILTFLENESAKVFEKIIGNWIMA